MSSFRDIIEKLRHGQAGPYTHARIPDHHVVRDEMTPQPAPGGCFTVVVNGMRLEMIRKWGKVYDPMVLAVSEFLYDGARRTVTSVVGASMVSGATHGVPQAMTFADSRVAGPHPFHGQLAVTFILYRVLRDDYVRAALGAVQRICGAVGPVGALSTALDIGEGVLDAVDAAFGRQQIEPELGCRIEHNADRLKCGSYAVLSQEIKSDDLWLERGELRTGPAGGPLVAVGPANQILYTVADAPPVDLDGLPWFRPLWKRIVQWANIPNDEAKEVAKSYLGALYEEIASSPDIPGDSVDDLYTHWEDQAKNVHLVARRRACWGPDELRRDPVRSRALAIREAW